MSEKRYTPDEKFLLQLYRIACAQGDSYISVDYREIAARIGQKETAVKNIIKHLAQANFIQKTGETTVIFTKHGCNFILEHFQNEIFHT
ncbi:MAG TPA: hypothetical protein VLE95_06045 [Chlamydiales bacterium]|nr:hypothetical protein [Chlamydiales bacterium]